MAIFGIGKKKETAAPAKAAEKKSVPAAAHVQVPRANGGSTANLAHVLRHARITEKATMHSARGVYTFDIAEGATKRDVAAAVRALYRVTPEKVAVVSVPSKVRRNVRTGKVGIKRGGKKAYVFLKEGETITIS